MTKQKGGVRQAGWNTCHPPRIDNIVDPRSGPATNFACSTRQFTCKKTTHMSAVCCLPFTFPPLFAFS
jgi:hypothetical protein